ncbi:3-hydroxyacyl-CoA dehydrogenase NAD-binding domain-containing protein [uncultured Psychrobacter sp.]|uniref:3-hydroxyacyl-CoA dehydrogenase NAD-binding domain-containing protein n=1 Tax=uncultured Psychrobacter sp. TaxID=259303 RepID=UPI0034573F7A
MSNENVIVGVIGAGTMGQGIVQLALQAGHSVVLVDQADEQLQSAKSALDDLFTKFVKKQKITQSQKDSWLSSLTLSEDSSQLTDAKLVIEAIVERMDIKQQVFSKLESIVSPDAILATNTSSLSVTAIASALANPQRFIGLHFFNPPGIMPLVEVIDALQTDAKTTQTCMDLMQSWGKSPVRCKNTPGFIVNRVARPFYTESFRLLEDQITTPANLDASIRSAGFKMGPCELTDFIGQDINYAVSCSLFDSLFYPAHLRPSYIQGSLVEAGFLGRKSGRGFYDYDDSAKNTQDSSTKTNQQRVSFSAYGKHPWIIEQLNNKDVQGTDSDLMPKAALADAPTLDALIGVLENNVHLYASDGKLAEDWEAALQVPVVLVDIKHPDKNEAAVAIAAGPKATDLMTGKLPQTLGKIDWIEVADCPGLINIRVISMIINEATICATQGIASPEGIDSALKGGVNYPLGAFEWLEFIGVEIIVNTLTALRQMYGSGRYVVPRMLAMQLNDMQKGASNGL